MDDGDRATRAFRLHRRSDATQEAHLDPTRFDRLAIAAGKHTTRRTTLGLLAALGLTGVLPEEAGAVCKGPGARCTKADAAFCCSQICRKKRCRCPQRVCCQCGANTVPCSFVRGLSACQQRCSDLSAGSASVVEPQPGTKTTVCNGRLCSQVACA